jgi:NAD(P)H-hydrate epimerase
MKLVSVLEMQAIEREADAAGFTYAHMMEHAGNNLAQVVMEECAEMLSGGILGLVGSGNNGGDTLVALAQLAEEGVNATACIVRPRPLNDPLIARLSASGGKVIDATEILDYAQFLDFLTQHSILLDGILGTGFHLPLKDDLARLMEAIKNYLAGIDSPPFVVAVDCPSGVDCDSGAAADECLQADLTVTMAAIKQGLLKFPAYNLVGKIRLVGIGLPADGAGMAAWDAVHRTVVDKLAVQKILPRRRLDAHKGTFGTALIIAGSVPYTGAALLAAEAAYRVGAGLVTLAIPESLHSALAGRIPEATWLPLPEDGGFIASDAVDTILRNLDRPTAVLIGPGLGMEEPTARFMRRILGDQSPNEIGFLPTQLPKNKLPPLVIDADGLKLLAHIEEWPRLLLPETILTPHPGEMSALTGLPTAEIQANRLPLAEKLSREWNIVLVLKGAFTVIATPDGRSAMIPIATPALARAGTGDVLAGLIVGLRAQGVPAADAAIAGAWIHAQAGLAALEQVGNSASVLAGDVLKACISVMNRM